MIKDKSVGSKVFDTINGIIMLLLIFCTLYPFWFVLIGSFNDGNDLMKKAVYLLPRVWCLDNYRVVLQNTEIYQALLVTLSRTIIVVVLNCSVTLSFAYAYGRTDVPFKKGILIFCMIPMYVSGGVVPYYQLILMLRLDGNFLLYILPCLFSFWNILILKTYMLSIPMTIDEAAKMDGASHFQILSKLILPLSMPCLAALIVFVGVAQWNAYYDSMVFMTSTKELRTLQHIVMIMIKSKQTAQSMANHNVSLGGKNTVTADSLQYATIIFVTLPIIVIYPFMQKYFVKGVLIGSVKG